MTIQETMLEIIFCLLFMTVSAWKCPPGTPELCEDSCVNFQTDCNNCGNCFNKCPIGFPCVDAACGGCALEANIVFQTFNNTIGYTPATCLSDCRGVVGLNTAYYSLSVFPLGGEYFCHCYDSTYVFTPPISGDMPCPVIINGVSYGTTNSTFGIPNTEYAHVVSF
jgi:hypothetical protein